MTTTEQRDVAADFMAATAGRAGGTAPQQVQGQQGPPSGAPATAAQYNGPWGPTSDPRQALAALAANPDFNRALMNKEHPGHEGAVAKRSELFAAMYPDDAPADPSLGGPGAGWDQPSDEEMQAQTINTTTAILGRYGVEDEDAHWLAQTTINAGLNTTEVGLFMKEMKDNSFDYINMKPEDVKQAIDEKVRDAALKEARRLELPAELLNYQVTKNLVLGEFPPFIKALAHRVGVR